MTNRFSAPLMPSLSARAAWNVGEQCGHRHRRARRTHTYRGSEAVNRREHLRRAPGVPGRATCHAPPRRWVRRQRGLHRRPDRLPVPTVAHRVQARAGGNDGIPAPRSTGVRYPAVIIEPGYTKTEITQNRSLVEAAGDQQVYRTLPAAPKRTAGDVRGCLPAHALGKLAVLPVHLMLGILKSRLKSALKLRRLYVKQLMVAGSADNFKSPMRRVFPQIAFRLDTGRVS
jgi:hypothetical protein